MKSFFRAFVLILAVSAVCVAQTNPTTPNLGLALPTVGEAGWGLLVDGNFTLIDTEIGQLRATYQGTFGTGPGQPFTVSGSGTYGASTYSSLMSGILLPSGAKSLNNCSLGPTGNVGGSWYQTITTVGYDCAAAPVSGTGTINNVGRFSIAFGADPAQRPVGVIAWGQAMANGVNAYGLNVGCEDNPGLTGIVLSCSEFDMEPYGPPSSYSSGVGARFVLSPPTHQIGTFPYDAIDISTNTVGATMRSGLVTFQNVFSSTSQVLNINTLSSVTPGSGVNSNSPVLFQLHEAYDTGSAQADAFFSTQAIIGTGANPTTDAFRLSHGNGPTGQTHYFELDSTITGLKTLGLYPEASYTVSTLPVSCGAATKSARYIVNDQNSSSAYFSSYNGGGSNSGPIFCTYNSSTAVYSWVVGG